jgi:hypothetical protein
MKQDELKKLIALAKLAPGIAHLPSFGLLLYSDKYGPVCELCGGKDAPIIDGRHLEDSCQKATK